jgi:hypothetical protein
MKTTELDFRKLFTQADEIFEFSKCVTGTLKQRYQAVQQYTYQRRSEDKEFIYLSTSGVTDDRVGWILSGQPVSTQKEMKAFYNKVSEIGNSNIGLTYYMTFYENGNFDIEIKTRDRIDGIIERTVIYFKKFEK